MIHDSCEEFQDLSGGQMVMGTHRLSNITLTRRLVTAFQMGTTVFRKAYLGSAVRSVIREYPTGKHSSRTVAMRYLTGMRLFQTVCTSFRYQILMMPLELDTDQRRDDEMVLDDN